jgi:hypothetical protein
MGTSSSSKGRKNNSPLVPAHADAEPEKPLPEPQGLRFKGFRTEFGKAVAGAGSFTVALGKYARDATGGTSVGPRRFGTAYIAGGSLIGLLGELKSGGTGEQATGIDLSALRGQPLASAFEAIGQALAPPNADADLIRVCVQEALAEVMPDVASFEPADLTDDMLIGVLIEFFARVLFQEITDDAGDAWNKTPDAERTIQAENELFDIIHAAVDKHMSPALVGGVQNLTREQILAIERRAVDEIWSEWESNE